MNYMALSDWEKNKIQKYTNELANKLRILHSRMENCEGICEAAGLQEYLKDLQSGSNIVVASDLPQKIWRENKKDVIRDINSCGKLLSKSIRMTKSAKLLKLLVIWENAYSLCINCEEPAKTKNCPVLNFLKQFNSITGVQQDER